MKRRLFFWFDKLNISQHERGVLFCLMLLLSSLVLVNAIVQPHVPYSNHYYASLDRAFKAKTRVMKRQEHRQLMKYKGQKDKKFKASALKTDTSKAGKENVKSKTTHATLINVNTASAQQLQKLHGIGPTYAKRIIAYRQKKGSFKTKEELIKIKGIGKKRLANIKPFIQLTGKQ